MLPSALDIRPFRSRWDFPLLLALKSGGSARPNEAERLRRWLCQPGMHPERDCFLAFEAGTPAGYAYVIVEGRIQRGVLMLGTAGGRAGGEVEPALVEAAAGHTRGLGLMMLDVDVPEAETARAELLVSLGFTHVRSHWHMRREDRTHTAIRPPAGARLRLAERGDVPAVTALQNAAFTGSWGYCPNTPEEIEYRIFNLPVPGPDPVVLLERDGALLAYCWNHREGEGPGIVSMVGVDPSSQGQGLGRAAAAAGVDHWVERGVHPVDLTVDSDNTPAVRLYQRLRFELQWRSLWYRRALG